MVERKTIRSDEQVSEELLGAKVYFTDSLVTGLESPDGKRTSVNYLHKSNGQVKHEGGVPVVDEVVFADGTKLKRDPESGDFLDVQGRTLYDRPVVHSPSMGDNEAFIRYSDTIGNPHTIFASRGDVAGPSLPIDKGLLLDLWTKNLSKIDSDRDQEISLKELVKAIENSSFTGMDAIFLATLKKRFDIISQLDSRLAISRRDIEKLDRAFQNFRPGYTGKRWGVNDDLDSVLNSWVLHQNKARFVTSKLYEHGPTASIRPEYVLQGNAGNCYWQSSLMTVAKADPKLIENMIKPGADGTWQVLFPQKRWCNEVITVNPLTETEQLLYSGAAGGGQWSGILEKAMAQYKDKYASYFKKPVRSENQTLQDFTSGGPQVEMINLLTDKICAGESPHASTVEKLHELLTQSVAKNMPMGAGMDKPTVNGLHGNHNYAILGYDGEKRQVTLYDPNHYLEPRDNKGRVKDHVRNGIFTMSLEEFKSCCDEFNFLDKPTQERVWSMPPIVKGELFVDSNIVKSDGQVRTATQDEAIELCKQLGGHLPSAREFAQYMNPEGIMEESYVEKEYGGKAPEGYYKVACENDGGMVDVFYFNNSKAHPLSGEIGKLSFWTSSKVIGNSKYGHVFYGFLGGGRPSKDDHEGSYKHAVLFVRPDSQLNNTAK